MTWMTPEELAEKMAQSLLEPDIALEETLASMGLSQQEIEKARWVSVEATLATLVNRGLDPLVAEQVRRRAEQLHQERTS